MKSFLKGWTLAVLGAAVLVAACGETPVTGFCDPADPDCTPTDTTGTDTTTTPDPLTVLSVTPADGSADVETSANVSIIFSRPVNDASVTATSVTVGSAAGDRSVSGSTVTFTPTDELDEGTSYTVTVNGVTDADGVGLGSAFTSSFTTRSLPLMADAGEDFDVSFGDEVVLEPASSPGTGATVTWTQISGESVGALSGESPSFTAAESVGVAAFELEVTDGAASEVDTVRVWILEDAEHAIWVSPSGSSVAAGGVGTRESPLASIQAAIVESDNAGFLGDVYVAAGNYDETLSLAGNVSMYGGFDDADWSRDVDSNKPVIVSGEAIAVTGIEADNLTIEGFEIIAADATGTAASSMGVLLNNSSGVLIAHNSITSGAGTAGVAGTAHTGRARTGNSGSGGRNSVECFVGASLSGGSRGATYRRGGNGGASYIGHGGGGQSASSTASGGGGGGSGGANGGASGGNAWASGAAGTNGAAGDIFGSLTDEGIYVPESVATGGGRGGAGYGGGGGGAGEGINVAVFGACGGSGGGGGAGGEGGAAGRPGTGGGGSFGIVLVGLSVAEIVDNDITTGVGGRGGAGSNGQSGGFGGSGGRGGSRACDSVFPSWCSYAGGAGGNGSTGGRGGHAGGGGGGPSIGILEGVDASLSQSGNVMTLGGGGAGGASAGNDGPTGESVEHKKITS